MRSAAWIAVIILAVVVGCGVWAADVTTGVSAEYVRVADELLALTQKQDWQRASQVLEARRQSWRDTEDRLQMLVNHEDTDAVTMALETIRAGIETADLPTCVLGCRQLREAADHIHHRDAFSWGNIL